jgi:thiopeptide-type bacteriocin biosynthesis protein
MSVGPRGKLFQEFVDSGFFVLRTPLLPLDELVSWGAGLQARMAFESGGGPEAIDAAWRADLKLLRGRILQVIHRPDVLHALFVASPSLQSGVEYWKRDPDSKRGIQAERALVRYFERMASRATPFGLFSGCSLGQIAAQANESGVTLSLKPRTECRPCTRLDFDYLFALTDGLRRDPAIASQLCYWPNSSLSRTGGVFHYIESRTSAKGRSHHFVKVESDDTLEAALRLAQGGATTAQLSAMVLGLPGNEEVTEDEAAAYVQELIDNGLLVSSLTPPVTGQPPLDDLICQIERLSGTEAVAATLRGARERMADLDGHGIGVDPEDYRAIGVGLENLPAAYDLGRLFQVDMIRPVDCAVLTKAVTDDLLLGAEALCRLGQGREPEPLRVFREAFVTRYERERVPLLEALDDEAGIGFDSAGGEGSPLIRGLQLGGSTAFKPELIDPHVLLLQKLLECARSGRKELELEWSDLPAHEIGWPIPDSIAVNGTLVAASAEAVRNGDYRIRLKNVIGPDGARFLGRFCHADPELERLVRRHLKDEEAANPGAVYAEIVYLPEGRIGNVLCRPLLRDYEIVYLGRSGAPLEYQIPVDDLLVSVEGGRITLHSRRLQREIIPRLSNAHGFLNKGLAPVYRFLCFLQHQHGTAVPGFTWGPAEAMDTLPRIRLGRIVLYPARWLLNQSEIAALVKPEKSGRFVAVQELRRRRDLPRWILLEEADNTLTVDLDNALSIDAFLHVLQRKTSATLLEMYPAPDELCVTSSEGRFHHEFAVPFVRQATEATHVRRGIGIAEDTSPGLARVLAPGSEWMYLKLYGGAATLDDILTASVGPLVRRASERGIIDGWFFLRYADPDDHLRVRFHGDPGRLRAELLPLITTAFHPLLASRRLWKMQFDTYRREVERYGGVEGMPAAERIFCADSQAVLEILQELAGDEGLDLRWRAAILGVDALLNDFGFDLAGKREVMERIRDGYHKEFKVEVGGRKQLGDRFRNWRRDLEALLDPSSEHGATFEFARRALAVRSAANAPVVRALRTLADAGNLELAIADLVGSFVHMHCNRMIRAATRQHELVLYDFLFRLYDGKNARERQLTRGGVGVS